MKRTTNIVLLLLFLSIQSFAQHGYLRKSNEIGLNIFDALVQQNFAFQYKRYISSNWGITADYQTQSVNKLLLSDNTDQSGNLIDFGHVKGSANTFGIGFVFCFKSTGSPFPYGNYIGLSVYTGSSNTNEIIDSIASSFTYQNTFNSFRLFLGKTIYLYNNCNMDIGLQLGATTGTIHNTSSSIRNPICLLPMQNMTMYKNYNNDQPYLSFVFNPIIKLCYLF